MFKMFKYYSENTSAIVNVNNVIQNQGDISKALTRIKEYFLQMSKNSFS